MRLEFAVKDVEAEQLNLLGFQLLQDIEQTVNTYPENGKLRLRENLVECLNEYPFAEAIYKSRFTREQGQDPDQWYYFAVDVFGALESVISDLLKLLVSRYPDTLEKVLVIDSKSQPIKELVKQFIPVYDPFSRSLGLHRPLPTATTQPASGKPKKNRPVSNPGFDTYIVEEHRARLMPYLFEQYKGMMPIDIVPMLYALEKLEMLTIKVIKGKIDLRGALIKTFGGQLKDSALKASIPTYDPDERYPDSAKQQKIEQHRQKIDLHMKGKTA